MPRVPQYNVPTVSPQDIPDIRGYASAQTFGAGIGQAVAGIGTQIERTGDTLAANALRLQERLNQADADTATADWVVEQAKLDMGHKALEGKARASAFPKYIEDTRALREKYASRMGNPEARRLFNNETRRLAAYSIRNEAYGVGQQLKQYNSDANRRLLTMAEYTVEANPGSDGSFTEALDVAKRAVKQESLNRTWEREETDFKMREVESNLWKKRITTLSNTDITAAVKLYDTNKDKLTPTDRTAVEGAINTGKTKAGTEAALFSEGMKRAVEADVESILKTGVPNPTLKYDEVRAGLGVQGVLQWQQARVDAEIIYNNVRDLATMTPDQMRVALQRIEPVPGTKDFVRQQLRYNAVKKAMEEKLELRKADPAASVADDPLVKDIMKKFTTDDSETYKLLIDARLAAQTKAGIPKEFQSPATVAETAPLLLPLEKMVPGQELATITEVAKKFQEKFGENWERVFTQALFARRFTNEVRTIGASVVRKMLRDKPLDRETIREIPRAAETMAAEDVVRQAPTPVTESGFYVDEMGMTQPIIARPPRPKPKLSEEILKRYPLRNKDAR